LRGKDEERADRARKFVEMSHSHWDKRLASQPWMCGANFSMADCAAIPAMHYAQVVVPFTRYPNVVAYWQRARERPSYRRVRAEFEPIWEGMQAQAQRKAS
jgi:glutathione S-transferase